MVALLGRCLALMIRRLGVGWIVRNTVARRGVSIVLYHDPRPAQLDAHLEYLCRRYSVIPLSRLVEALHSGRWDDIPPKSVVINLDDGRAGNFALAELFHRHGVVPTIFLCSQIAGTNRDFLDAREIRAMGKVCEFASHSRFHPVLTACTEAQAWEEIAESRPEVEAITGHPCRHFAYPAGRFAEREARMTEKAGYRSARTIDIGWNMPGTDPFRLKVLSIDSRSTTMLAAELAGLKWLSRLVNGKGGLRGRRRTGRGARRGGT